MNFKDAALPLRERGYSVIPLMEGQKYPLLKKWTQFCAVQPAESDYLQWFSQNPRSNIGLCLGAASKVLALDYDYDMDGLHDIIQGILPPSPARKRGGKGFTAFYRFSGEKTEQFTKNGKVVVEILSHGRQTVLPPSIHPDTKAPYVWLDEPLDAFFPHDLPKITLEQWEEVRGLFVQQRSAPKSFISKRTDSREVLDCLKHISADVGRDEWLRVMFAIKDTVGESGYDIFDRWSASGSKYKGPVDTQRTWDSANREGITFGTLMHIAYEHGMPKPEIDVSHIIPGGNLTIAPVKSDTFPEHLFDAPGVVGQMFKYIESSSIYPQPVLTLAAAIAFTGTLYGHRIQSETGLRTNIYTLGVAPSGAGKDHARKIITQICADVLDADKLLAGDPASGSGLITSLKDAEGVCLVLWDEFGKVLSLMTDPRAPTHMKEIVDQLTKLFSSASTTYLGKQYANRDAKSPRVDIKQPCLSVYGTTVPNRFYESVTSGHALDGFLPRMLIFESEDYALAPLLDRRITPTPQYIIDTVKRIISMPKRAQSKGNLDLDISPVVVCYSDEARVLIDDFQLKCRQLVRENMDSPIHAVYARAAEHAIKLALIAHEGDSISARVMKWAIELSIHCSAHLITGVRDKISATYHEADLKRLLHVFTARANSWFDKSEIISKSQWCQPSSKRNDYLSQLVEMGKITREKLESKTRTGYRYGYFVEQKNTPNHGGFGV